MSSKVIVVTGTNRGIGFALATQFSKRGDTVIATVRSKAKAVGTPLASLPNVTLVELDADNLATIDSAVAEIEKIAPEGIDELWNNLAVYNLGQNVTSVRSIVPADAQKVFQINVIAPVYLSSKLLPLLEKRATKKIVFVSTVAASFEFSKNYSELLAQFGAPYIYGASKSALNMAGLYFHIELNSSGFTVIPLHPGVVQTDMNPTGQGIDTEESATKMIDVVDAVSAKDEFVLRSYDGSVVAW
ncbi:hypothetical protein POJ06DRAFT_293891 [Lipomyces tetrasporus]|uniref:NAD(P)-binding protein n=1 Tax=Lipomyces tetrasporus TaxID=54092 RepID=A0AAD7R024_9ASCO|nr:uncharacterized protein POJ06DRAFT_293891 [Lipomyces tetrasporus]KAJ8104373.1 hypothetical protein POJ06DRAFT_293891 [Lipomyces tetrasporus]